MTINSISRSVLYLVLFGGFALTALGLWQQWGTTITPTFTWESLPNYSIALVVFGVVIEGVSIISRGLSRLVSGGIIACIIAILTNTIWPLLVTVWFAFASYLLGRAMLTLLKINTDKLSTVTMALVGAGIYGTFVGLLAHFPINYPGLYGIALAIPVIFGWRSITDGVCSLSEHLKQPSKLRWLDLVIAAVALFYFSVALMPEMGADALAMHLFIPGHLLSRHEWGFDVTTYVWAVLPMMGDWIYSIGYMLAGETAARMMNVGFIFVLCWLIRDLVIWAGGNAVGARWAILLFLTTPLTFTESSSLFIESIWTSFIVAGSLSVFKLLQSDNDQSAHLPVAGFLLGAALAAKAVTFTILPVLLLLLVWQYRAWAQHTKSLLLFFAVGIIPYATAWHLTGNPVFPFFNKLFQSPFYPSVKDFNTGSRYGEGFAWDVLYQVTFHTEKFLEGRQGASGFQWLLLFLPVLLVLLFSRRHRGVILFVVGVLSIALTFQSQSYLRYVFPSFVWVAAGMGVALSTVAHADTVLSRRVLSIAGCTAVLLNLVFFKSGTYFGELSLQPLMSPSGRETYLNNRLPIRNAVELVNKLNVSHSPVAVFSNPLTAGLDADGLYPNWYNHQFQAKVFAAKTLGAVTQVLLAKGIDYVILDSTWGNADNREVIEDATQNLAELRTTKVISVRKLKSNYQSQAELLKNPDFSSLDGWVLRPDMSGHSLGNIIVSASSPAYQIIPVEAGHLYQNSVTAQCPDRPTKGRIQVNWLDQNSRIITTNSRVFECTSVQTSHTMEAKAPPGALTAIVYAAGHTNIPVIFNKVSFKQ
jgi:4-amino-4-deoxy-L-arabinose transferase-like glycosyltransferase